MEPRNRDFFTGFSALTAVVALVFAVVAMGRPGTAPVSAGGATTTLQVTLGDNYIEPAALTAPAGRVVLDVVNGGVAPHDVHVVETGAATPLLDAGERTSLDLGVLAPGTYTLYCEVPGHRPAGMEATLTVTEGDGAVVADPADHGDHGDHGDVDWRGLDRKMAEGLAAFPAETEGLGGELLAPRILPDGTKEFELTAAITDWEVEPGRVVQAWTYNGVVPGPTIKVDVGDRVRIVLHNELPISTDLHAHGIDLPFEQDGVAGLTQPFVEPGQTFVYEYNPQRPAVAMYHPHHHAHRGVPNGMLGAFLVGDMPVPEGVTVSQELPMVLNDAGVIGFALNGKSFPATAPVVAGLDDWVLIHYMNEGLEVHPMHLHGLEQLVIAKDGFPLPAPYLADTVNVAPGERFSVLVHAHTPGVWAFHCHVLTHAENDDGLFGMTTAFIVE